MMNAGFIAVELFGRYIRPVLYKKDEAKNLPNQVLLEYSEDVMVRDFESSATLNREFLVILVAPSGLKTLKRVQNSR